MRKHHPPNMSPHSQKLIQAYKFFTTIPTGSQKKLSWAEVNLLCVSSRAINLLLYETIRDSLLTHLFRSVNLGILQLCGINLLRLKLQWINVQNATPLTVTMRNGEMALSWLTALTDPCCCWFSWCINNNHLIVTKMYNCDSSRRVLVLS